MEATFQTGLSTAWRRIPKTAKAAFGAAFIVGVLTYLYALTRPLLCVGDAFNNVYSTSNQVGLGRWSCSWLCSFTTEASMPLVNGLMGLLCTAVLSGMVVVLLQVQSPITAALCGMVLVCYPAVGDTLKFTHLFDGYMLASMLSVLALLLTDRYPRFGFIIGIPLLALGLGTYQANFSFVLALMAVRAVGLLLQPGRTTKQLWGYIWRYAVLGAVSLGLYYALSQIASRQSGIAFSAYQNVNSMGSLTPKLVWQNFVGCYRDFKQQITFLSFRPGFYVNGYANYLLVAMTVGLVWLGGITCRERTAFRMTTLAVLTVLMPFLLCSIRIFNPDHVHSLMKYSVSGLYLLTLCLSEGITGWTALFVGGGWLRFCMRLGLRVISWLVLLCLIVSLYAWVVGINLDYFEADLEYENIYAQCVAYLSAAEDTEGYQRGMPIYVVGQAGTSGVLPRKNSPSKPMYTYAFMKFFLNVDMPFGIARDIEVAAEAFRQTATFADMPCYPMEGCTVISDGALYLKLSE